MVLRSFHQTFSVEGELWSKEDEAAKIDGGYLPCKVIAVAVLALMEGPLFSLGRQADVGRSQSFASPFVCKEPR